MFTSFASNIERIVTAVVGNIPSKNINILDIGGAFGKYALLIKEGIASLRSESGDLSPDISDINIDNYDIAPYFLEKCDWLKSLYKNNTIGDVKNLIFAGYDIILMIDVIEHWNMEETFKFIDAQPAGSKILISTPKQTVMYKERHYGFDQHQTQWTIDNFLKYDIMDYSTSDSLILLIKK